MKRLTLIFCLALAVALTGMAFAQTSHPAQKQTSAYSTTSTAKQVAPQQTNTTPKEPAQPKQPVHRTAVHRKNMEMRTVGTIVSVDAVANSIVVKHKNVDETFQVEPQTKIMIAGKEAKLGDMKKDSKVTVIYKVEGNKKIAVIIK